MALLTGGILVFIGATMRKSSYELHQQRYPQPEQVTVPFAAEADRDYQVSLWAVDEESGFPAHPRVAVVVEVMDAKGTVLEGRQVACSCGTSDNSPGSEGPVRAQNCCESGLHLSYYTELTVRVDVAEADYLDITIYRDLPVWLNLLPGIGILVALAGGVLWLRGRAGN